MNGLPVYLKMLERGIQLGWDCPVCGDEPESLIHALISCDFALSVWSLWQDCPLHLLLKATDLIDVIHIFCSSPFAEHLEYFFAISWAIWHNRNLLVHNEKSLSPLQVWDLARNVVNDFHEANTVLWPMEHASNGGWVAPPTGYFKVNVDGASPLDDHSVSGVGAIVRDDSGNIVAALSKALPSHYPAEWTELLAMEQGVLLAMELGIPNVIFESDAASVVQAVMHDPGGGESGHLIQEIQMAKSSFSSCSFQHVKRDYNRAAHEVAHFAKCNNANYVWKDDFPLFLKNLIQAGLG